MTEELEIREALAAIRKKKHGNKALEILDVITYLAPENIHMEILSSLIKDEEQLRASIQLLHQYSIVYYDQDKTIFNMHKTAKQVMVTILEKQNRKLQVLKKVTQLLHHDKYNVTHNRVEHYTSVWYYLRPYPQLIELYSEVPTLIALDMGKMMRLKEAIKFAFVSLILLHDTLGERHRSSLMLRSSIPILLANDGKHEEALKMLLALFEINLECSEPDEVRNTVLFIASELFELNRYDEALNIYSNVYQSLEVSETDDDAQMLLYWYQYAEILGKTGKFVESDKILRQVLEKGNQIEDFRNNHILLAKSCLANVLIKQSKYSEALELYRQVCSTRIATLGEDHEETLEVKRKIVAVLEHQGKSDQASAVFAEVTKNGMYVDRTNELRSMINVKVEPMCSAAKRGYLHRVRSLVKRGADVNKKDNSQKSPLHYAAAHNHVGIVKFLLCKGVIYNQKDKDGKTPAQISDNSKIRNLLNSVENLIKDVKEGNFEKVCEHLAKEQVIVNAKDNDGCNSLHWAAHNGHRDIASLLLEIEADATQLTNKGNTPLHIATCKGHGEIVEVLLKYVKRNELDSFINAQTFGGGVTAIHVAAKNGFLDIVKSLLKHGAIYNTKNKEGKTPVQLSKDRSIIDLLKLIDRLFDDAKNGNPEIISRLRSVKADDFRAFTSARDNECNTLLQVTVANKHENIANKLSQMCEAPLQTPGSSEWTLDKIKKLKRAVEVYIELSSRRLLGLRSVSSPNSSENNPDPMETLMDGSNYLSDVHHFVEVYKTITDGSIDNENIQRVNDALVKLEFDPVHIASDNKDITKFNDMLVDPEFDPITTRKNGDGDGEYFILKGEDQKYFKMLHSKSKRDVKLFLDVVNREIEFPVRLFLESLNQRLQYVIPDNFFKAIQNNDHLDVKFRIREGADVNCKNTDGRTPLHYAVNNGNLGIVNILLENGADATQATAKGNTPLHTATSKDLKEIIEVLLKNVGYDKLNDFVNAKTTVAGTTALHVAAKNGSIEIVKIFFKKGAFYNVKNNEGKTPLDLTKDRDIKNLLKLTSELYQDGAEGNNCKIITQLQQSDPDLSNALTSVRNDEGHKLVEVTLKNMRQNGRKLRELLNVRTKCKLDEFKNLKDIVELHMGWCKLYLWNLCSISESRDSDNNRCRSITLKDGTYYLETALILAGICEKKKLHGLGYEDLQTVHNTVEALEFDLEHITSDYNYVDGPIYVAEAETKKYYKLLHSESTKDVRNFIEIVKRGIESPVKKFVVSIKQKIQSLQPEKLFTAIEDNNISEVEYRVREGVDVNSKSTDGRTPLHYAVGTGNLGIVGILLENGADATQITSYGNTSLHIATCEGRKEIVEVLLQHVSNNNLDHFINAKTFENNTSLHLASKNGCLEIVKSLLRRGAAYNVCNDEGKIPLYLTKDRSIANLLTLISELFRYAKDGDSEIIGKLQALKPDEFIAVSNACDANGDTLLQVMTNNKRQYISSKFLELIKNPNKIPSGSIPEWKLDQVEKLKGAAESYIEFSESYLRMLRNTSQSNRSEKNSFPWATLKAGSHYLQDAYSLVEEYKGCSAGVIDDENIRVVNDTLVELEFDPKHITSGYTDEAYDGKVECFVSKGQGTKYYELLHSELKKDVRYFVETIEPKIDVNIKRFLESMKQKLRSIFSKMLFEAIERNDHLEVKNCIREEGVVNEKGWDGRIPLLCAVDNKNMGIVNILLKNGADVTLVGNQGQTALHIASCKGLKIIIEALLDHVSHEKMNDFINAKTTVAGLTPLHVTASNGMFEIVKSLLTRGAIYNLRNAEGKTPLDLVKGQNVMNLLEFVHALFEDAETGNPKIISKLKAAKLYEFTAVTNTRNEQGQSLFQVAKCSKHQAVVGRLRTIIKSRSITSGH